MRIALVSDIHGNLPALEAVAADIRRRDVDRVINLGDSLSGPLMPRETAQFLMASGWLSLAGNHERYLLHPGPAGRGPSDAYAHSQLGVDELNWLATQPATLALSEAIFLCHGTPGRDDEFFLESLSPAGLYPARPADVDRRVGTVRAALLACGHSHIARAVRSGTGQLIVNPGSVGLQAFEDDEPFRYTVENGSPDARYAIVELRGGGWQACLHTVPYDFAPMARLADQRGRPEWAFALRYGYIP